MTKALIQKYVDFIENNPCGTWTTAESNNGVITMPYVTYSPIIHELISRFEQSDLVDFQYLEHFKALFEHFDELLPSMTVKQIGTCLTYIFRTERFCEGFLLTEIENGRLVALLKQLAILL